MRSAAGIYRRGARVSEGETRRLCSLAICRSRSSADRARMHEDARSQFCRVGTAHHSGGWWAVPTLSMKGISQSTKKLLLERLSLSAFSFARFFCPCTGTGLASSAVQLSIRAGHACQFQRQAGRHIFSSGAGGSITTEAPHVSAHAAIGWQSWPVPGRDESAFLLPGLGGGASW